MRSPIDRLRELLTMNAPSVVIEDGCRYVLFRVHGGPWGTIRWILKTRMRETVIGLEVYIKSLLCRAGVHLPYLAGKCLCELDKMMPDDPE